jgi:signal transduction histidine kinase
MHTSLFHTHLLTPLADYGVTIGNASPLSDTSTPSSGSTPFINGYAAKTLIQQSSDTNTPATHRLPDTVRVYIVEDEAIIADDLQRVLERMGYQVVGTSITGTDAIRHILETTPDIVIMDIMLKGDMDGITTVDKLYEDYQCPVIYLTAYADENTLRRAKLTEPFGYIIKPFMDREVYATIETALYKFQMERRLAESEYKLRELNHAKDKLFSIVSHDLRNQVFGLTSMTNFLSNKYSELEKEESGEIIETIHHSVKHLYTLLDNLLQWAQLQTQGIRFKPHEMNLMNICAHAIEAYQENIRMKSLTLINQAQTDCTMIGDSQLLLSAIQNLMSNAIKFTPIGGFITVTLAVYDQTAELAIADTGIGMTADEIQTLLSDEEHTSRRGTQNERGTGLGLILAKDFIELHKGTLTIKSIPQIGTTCTITLPR